MALDKIDSSTKGYFQARRAMTAWLIFKKVGNKTKQIGTFYTGISYLPFKAVPLTTWELQELAQLLIAVCKEMGVPDDIRQPIQQ